MAMAQIFRWGDEQEQSCDASESRDSISKSNATNSSSDGDEIDVEDDSIRDAPQRECQVAG